MAPSLTLQNFIKPSQPSRFLPLKKVEEPLASSAGAWEPATRATVRPASNRVLRMDVSSLLEQSCDRPLGRRSLIPRGGETICNDFMPALGWFRPNRGLVPEQG